ncbi:MAG: hypothetical protein WAO35_10965 [Terriglobia bacterium]
MPVFGVVSQEARGHIVTTILIAMIAMLFTAISYGRMARAHPSAGPALTCVGRELHPGLGFVTGWSMTMDTCSTRSYASSGAPKPLGIPRGVRTYMKNNDFLAVALSVVIGVFPAVAILHIVRLPARVPAFFTLPFYNPATFSPPPIFTGTSIAVPAYIGFDGISTLSEQAHNARQNILRAKEE